MAATLPGCRREVEPAPAGTPRLVVLIVVDQLRADYLQRFDRFWEGGLRYLLDTGVQFTDAHHDHAITATAPGHASLVTGCTPRRHTVFANSWVDRESGERAYSAADSDWNITPERLECSTLGSWMKDRYPTARVFAASAKDRSAVMMAGREADGVFFYDRDTGNFEFGDDYYGKEPQWLQSFNDQRWLDRQFGKAWKPLPATAEVLEEVGVLPFDMGPLEADFPIAFGGVYPIPSVAPGEYFYGQLYRSPFLDEYLARFAEHLIGEEALGGDTTPDLLGLGFSAADTVGHTYGPDSPQLLDTLRRLDRTLGELFEFLDRRIGLEDVVIALSADHGVAPVPEVRQARGLEGRRADTEDVLCVQRVYERLQGRLGDGVWLLPGPFVNLEAVDASGLDYEDVESVAEELMAECPAVVQVWTRSEMMSEAVADDPVGRLFANSYPPGVAPDFLLQHQEYFVTTRTTTTDHGSVWSYDSHVPLIVAAPGLDAATSTARVRTIDLAPTLATLLDLSPPDDIDGAALPISN